LASRNSNAHNSSVVSIDAALIHALPPTREKIRRAPQKQL
jgi:hypothetical protein